MSSITQAITLLGVALPKLRAEAAAEDLQAWKDGPLKEAWRAAAKANHPDRAAPAEREAATQRFATLSAAHDRLQALTARITDRGSGAAATTTAEAEEPATAAHPHQHVDARGRVHTTYVDAQGRAHTHVQSGGFGGGGGGGGGGHRSFGGPSIFFAAALATTIADAGPAPTRAAPPGFTPVGRGNGRSFVG